MPVDTSAFTAHRRLPFDIAYRMLVRVVSVGRPIVTADRISRFFVGVQRWKLPDVDFRLASVNGRIGALMFSAGRLVNAFSFEMSGDRIRTIFIVRNPEKLRHVTPGPN